MTYNARSPRRLQSTTPRQRHTIDSLIERLEAAKPLYAAIVEHRNTFANETTESTVTRAGGCKSANPLSEWTDVTDQPVHVLALLEKQGLIATIKVGDRYFSRPAE